MIKSEVRRILDIISNFSQNDVKKDVLETEIISRSGLSDVEVRNYLGELEWLQIGASMGSSYWNECRRSNCHSNYDICRIGRIRNYWDNHERRK